jgi:taurine dioxygenase
MGSSPPLRLGAQPIAGRVGAVVGGIDLREPLGTEAVEQLHWLMAERGVVIFTEQKLDPAGHRAFAQQLGAIRVPPDYFPTLRDEGYPEIGVLDSDADGLRAPYWHADVTWAAQPPRYSVLHMRACPDMGGDTMWVSLIEGYEQLSVPLRRFVEPLIAEHALGERSALHPVVHRHPVTGRLGLSVNPLWTRRITDLDDKESQAVLNLLYDKVLQPEATCRWRWHVGDIGVWDNHFVWHYAINDYDEAPRVIHRIEIEGESLIPAAHREARGSAATG